MSDAVEELGYLARGRRGIVEVSVARMLVHGGLRPTRRGIITATDPVPTDELDVAIRRLAGGRTLPELVVAGSRAAPTRAVERRAVEHGRGRPPASGWSLFAATVLPFVAVIVVGVMVVGSGPDLATVGVLAALACVTGALLAWSVAHRTWRVTRAGRRALRAARSSLSSTDDEGRDHLHELGGRAVVTVALDGMRALPDPDLVTAITTAPVANMPGPGRSQNL